MPTILNATRPPSIKKNKNIHYVLTWPKPDVTYAPSTAKDPKYNQVKAFAKKSWVLEGQDREAAVVLAIRNICKTIPRPEVSALKQWDLKEDEGIFNQLIGLAYFGARTNGRNKETYARSSVLEADQPYHKRVSTTQIIFSDSDAMPRVGGPRQLCMVLRDAMLGLLNAFRLGYVHREITKMCIAECKSRGNMGYMLSKDGKSIEGEPRHFSGMIYDFTVAQRLDGSDADMYSGDTEIYDLTESTPINLIVERKHVNIQYNPIYDLESFFWVLLEISTDIITDFVSGQRKLKLELLPERGDLAIDKMDISEAEPKADDTPKASAINLPSETEPVKEDSPPAISESVEEVPQAQNEAQSTPNDGDDKMEVDDEVLAPKPENAESDKDTDAEMKDNDDGTREQEIAHEDKPEMSEKAKGKQRATVESDNGESDNDENGEKSTNEGPESDSDTSSAPTVDIEDIYDLSDFGNSLLYYDASQPYMPFIIHRPFKFQPPPDFVPPSEPEYIAFEEDKSAFIIHTLLKPRRGSATVNKITRLHLAEKLPTFLESSPGLAPLRPLITALSDLAEEYRGPHATAPAWDAYMDKDSDDETKKFSQVPVANFSREEIEEAFARYLRAFEEHMPSEDNWLYMKLYEGTDALMKFGQQRQFLGAFAGPHYTSPS